MQKRVGLHKRSKQKNNLHTLKVFFFLIPCTKWKIKNNPKNKERKSKYMLYVC